MCKRHFFESEYRKGNIKEHTHVKFYICGLMIIVSRQMFIEHFPEMSKGLYLIKNKCEL